MAEVFNNDDAAFLIDRNSNRLVELAWSCSVRSKLREEGSITREYLNAMVARISNEDAAFLIDRNSEWILKSAASCSLAANHANYLPLSSLSSIGPCNLSSSSLSQHLLRNLETDFREIPACCYSAAQLGELGLELLKTSFNRSTSTHFLSVMIETSSLNILSTAQCASHETMAAFRLVLSDPIEWPTSTAVDAH